MTKVQRELDRIDFLVLDSGQRSSYGGVEEALLLLTIQPIVKHLSTFPINNPEDLCKKLPKAKSPLTCESDLFKVAYIFPITFLI